MSPIAIACFLLLSLSALPGGPGEQWRLVFEDGRLEGRTARPSGAVGGLSHAWAWSEGSAPRRIGESEIGLTELPRDRARLVVQVAGWNPRTMSGIRLIAGPLPMWPEIPEALMPSWEIPAQGRLSIPVDPARPWRLRLAGAGRGSWWVDVPVGRREVVLPAVPGEGFALFVVDDTGRGVDGAMLRLQEGIQGRRGGARPWAAYRAEGGRIRAAGLPDAEELAAVLAAPGYAPMVLRGRLPDLSGTVQLSAGASLIARFSDSSGRRLPGVEGRLETWIGAGLGELFVSSCESGDDGLCRMAAIPPGKAVLIATARDRVPYRMELDLPAALTDLGMIRLEHGVSLRVSVTDDGGAAVPGAQVSSGASSVRADARGLAVLPAVAPDRELELSGRAPRHVPHRERVEPPYDRPVSLVLQRAFTVQGRLIDDRGIPIAGGIIRLRYGNLSRTATGEADGRFELELPPATAANLTLTSPGTLALSLPLEPGAPGEVRDLGDVMAGRGQEISGRLVSAREGQPVAGGRVWVPRPSEQGALLAWVDRDLLEGASGPDGRFHLTGMAGGPVLLRVDAPGFARAHVAVPPPSGVDGTTDVGDVELREGGSVRVLVPAGEPAVARLDLRGDWLEMDMVSAPVRDGLATFRHVPVGRARVSVLRGETLLCDREVEVGEDTVDVKCSGGGVRVQGVVRVGGRAPGAGILTWLPPAPSVPGRIQSIASPGGLRRDLLFAAGRPQIDVSVAADGSFVTEEIGPGTWQVSWVADGGALSEPRQVEIPALPENSEHHVVLSFPGRTVTGVVLDTDGNPVARARVRLVDIGSVTWSAADGGFELGGLEAGRRLVQAEKGDLASPVLAVEVPADRPGEVVRLTLERRQEPELSVQVLGLEGSPVPGAWVILEEEGRLPRLLTADFQGRVRARIDAPLPPRVRWAAWAHGLWILSPWQSYDAAMAGAPLAARATGSLRIESAGGGGAFRLLSPEGWDYAFLATMTGFRPVVTPDAPLVISGLPVGTYSLALGNQQASVTLREGEQAELRLD